MDAETTEKMMSDLRAVVRDAEALLATAAGAAGEQLGDAATAARNEAREAARDIEAGVREHPWAAIGIAAGVGLVLGLLLGRR